MQPLFLPGAFMWSRRQPDRQMNFNSYLFCTPEGNVAIDPLPLEADELGRVIALGGLSWIIITNRDHVRGAATLRERFGAQIAAADGEIQESGVPVDRVVLDGERLFPGACAVALYDQKSPGEFAIHLAEHQTLIVGDALIGAPAGELSLLPDERYDDVHQTILSLRKLWALQPKALLTCDGAPLFSGATRAIGKLLFERGGIAVNRINLDELHYIDETERADKYACLDAEVGFWIGAQHLGYRVVKLPPGMRFCPVHAEFNEEELFIVLDGEPSIRTTSETLQCRRGDFIAFPIGLGHAHQVINESATNATILLLGENQERNVCYYPESDKVLVSTSEVSWMVRNSPKLDYYDGE